MYDKPEVFYYGNFVVWTQELQYSPTDNPPIKIQKPLFNGKPEEIKSSFSEQITEISKVYTQLQELTKAENAKLRGMTGVEIAKYYQTEPRKEIVEVEFTIKALAKKLEGELLQYCEKENRQGALKAKESLGEQESIERSLGKSQETTKQINYLREVIGVYLKWCTENGFTFPITFEEGKKGSTSQLDEINEIKIKKEILKNAKIEAYKRCQKYFKEHSRKRTAPMEICREVAEEYFPKDTDDEKTRLAKTIRTDVNTKKKPPSKRTIPHYNREE